MLLTRLLLYTTILTTRLWRAVRAPLTYWERRVRAQREHELALLQRQLDAQHGMVAAMAELMRGSLESVAQATAAQQELFKTWLDGFKTTEVPTATTVRESDEIEMALLREAEALRASGVPVHMTPYDTVAWLDEESAPAATALGKLGVDVDALKRHLQ